MGDYFFTTLCFLAQAIPNFLMAILLMFLAFRMTGDTMLGLFSTQFQNAPWSWPKVVDLLKHCIIPVLVIGLNNTCGLMDCSSAYTGNRFSKARISCGN